MSVKIKPINKNDWWRIIKKQTAFVSLDEQEGLAYLIKIQEIKEPLIKPCMGVNVKLADKGYYWLQIAPKNENFWLTAMYDEKENFVQYYFDVSRKNVINGENSYFEDLYLDVICLGEGQVEVLDKEDLENALKGNIISQSDYEIANKIVKQLMVKILKSKDEYDKICLKYLNLLKKKL